MYGEVTLMILVTLLLTAVVLLLLVIALGQIAEIRKTVRDIKETKPAPVPAPAPAPSIDRNNRFERKSGDFRRNEKRPYQDRPPRSQQQSAAPVAPASTPPVVAATPAADPVETSLRDINLRLKNAERDQESARKKIQENLGDRDHRGNDRGDRDRNDRGNDRNRDREGGDRDRNRGRDGSRDGGRDGNRDRNRGPRRDNWQDRNRPSSQQPSAPAVAQNTGDNQPAFERKEFPAAPAPMVVPVEQTMPPMSVAPQESFSPAPVVVDQAPADYNSSDEGFEHGRKAIVKRRPLREEGNEGSSSSTSAMEETSDDSSEGTAEIQFGRRKGL